MSSELLNAHIAYGEPCGQDADMAQLQDWAGGLLMDNGNVVFTKDELRDIRVCINVSMGSLDDAIKEEGDPIVKNGLTNRLMRYMLLLEKVRGFK